MGRETDNEVHEAADVDVDFLIGFLEVEVKDVEGALHTGVVDEAVDFWVVFRDFFDERGYGRYVASVKGVVGCCMAQFFGGCL